jgi:hypothetical protein
MLVQHLNSQKIINWKLNSDQNNGMNCKAHQSTLGEMAMWRCEWQQGHIIVIYCLKGVWLMDYTLLGDAKVENVIFICMKNSYLSDHAFEPISFFITLQSWCCSQCKNQ